MGIFDKAKSVEAPVTSKAKKAKPEYTIEGIATVSALDMAIKLLTAAKADAEAEVKNSVRAQFVNDGTKLKRRPENFRGVDGLADASCELRQRASTSPLSPEEVELLTLNKISTTEIVAREETFIINPSYLENSDLMSRVSGALEGIEGIPEDFIQKQDRASKRVVSEQALDQVFAGSPKMVDTLLRMVGVIALKPKFDPKQVEEGMRVAVEALGMDVSLIKKATTKKKVA